MSEGTETMATAIQLEGFELLAEVGRGATARIVLAREISSGERVCLKLFHPKLFEQGTSEARIRREMEVSVQLKHANILPVRRVVMDTPNPFMVMDYIAGENLEKFQGSLPYVLPEVAVLIVVSILRALEYAHLKGIVHRDLKPENVLVRDDGHIFVADFGLAKWRDKSVTNQSNTLLGTVDYMSPEQVAGDTVGPASDLFSVGAVLYFLTTGTRPFTRPSLVATLNAVKMSEPELPQKRNPKVSNRLSRLIQKALKKDTADRYACASSMREALEGYLREVGLDGQDFNMQEWAANPSGVTLEALQTCVEFLAVQAEKSLHAQEWDSFLEIQSHLSLKAPDSEALRRLSSQYRGVRRTQKRRNLWWCIPLSACLIAFCLLGFALKFRSSRQVIAPVELVAPAAGEVIVQAEPVVLAEAPRPAIATRPRSAKAAAASEQERKPGSGTVWFRVPEEYVVFLGWFSR